MKWRKKCNHVVFLDYLLRDADVLFDDMVSYCSPSLECLFVYLFLDRYTSMVVIDEKNYQNGNKL